MDEIDQMIEWGAGLPSGGFVPQMSSPTGTDWTSGLLQSAVAMGTGYLGRRLDIDLSTRLAGAMPQPQRYSMQPMLGQPGVDLTSRGVAAVGGMRMGDMLPFIALAVGAWLLLKK